MKTKLTREQLLLLNMKTNLTREQLLYLKWIYDDLFKKYGFQSFGKEDFLNLVWDDAHFPIGSWRVVPSSFRSMLELGWIKQVNKKGVGRFNLQPIDFENDIDILTTLI